MATEQATILIPDISGYTEFVSKTEIDQCIKTFSAFHREIRGIGSTSVCQCGACQGASGLTLKFVVHYGSISEIKVARFVKASGLDMVIAHRLLKNSIEGHEYLLLSRSYLDQVPDGAQAHDLGWTWAVEEYASIGPVGFDFANLESVRAALPQLPRADRPVVADDSVGVSIEIGANFMDVLAVLSDAARGTEFVAGLRQVEQDHDVAFIGGKHTCVFDDFTVEIEPMRIEVSDQQADYYESDRTAALNVYAVIHSRLTALGAARCRYEVHVYPEPGYTLMPATHAFLLESFEQTQQNLKALMESGGG